MTASYLTILIVILPCLTQVERSTLINPATLLTLRDAEQILGVKGTMTDSSSTTNYGTRKYACTFTATTKDQKDKLGALYFVVEDYPEISGAQQKYSSIKKANENSEGVKVLEDLCDEAYFHSDSENFYFVMARKGNSVFVLKLNKITSTTSLDEFNRIAKKICDTM